MENPGKFSTNTYDQVPYLGISHSLTHPDVMATIGTLLGLHPPDIRKCRVLELGCAGGSNLIPMALGLPGSEFFGLDYSKVQIDQGQQYIEKLGLKNINLKNMDIMEVGAGLGQFDYIIVHGIFSWVPESVREKILAICNDNLAHEGISYISYNTFPGWYIKKITRDMMLYHTRKINEPHKKIEKARAFVDFMTASSATLLKRPGTLPGENYIDILKHENTWLAGSSDTYLFHEELEENNDPLYFYQFAERAQRHGLQYLSEVSMDEVFMLDIPVEIRKSLLGMADDLIELEQYRDYLMNRVFRRTLLVHHNLPITRQINPERISGLFVGSNGLPASSSPDICSRTVEQFVSSPGVKMSTDHPVTKAAMLYLSEIWPQVVPLDELLETAYTQLRKASSDATVSIPENSEARSLDMAVLKTNLLQGFVSSTSLVELHVYSPVFAPLLSEYPVASPWARLQVRVAADRLKASQDQKPEPLTVTNLRHESIELEGLLPYLLYLLDGKHNRDDLLDKLEQSFQDGSLNVQVLSENGSADGQDGKRTKDIKEVRETLSKKLDEDVNSLARSALLIA